MGICISENDSCIISNLKKCVLKAQHNFSTQIVSTWPNITAYNALQILYRTLCYCIVWSSHCFSLAVVYYDSICWRYFTHALCTIYYSLNCFGLLAFFSTCGSIMRLQIPSSSSCFFDCSWWRTFLRYADSIVFLIKKNCHRSPVSDRTVRMFFIRHCMHSTTRLNFKSSLKKKLPFAVDYSLSALVYIFYPNPIAKNRLKTVQKYHFGWKKNKLSDVHSLLITKRPHMHDIGKFAITCTDLPGFTDDWRRFARIYNSTVFMLLSIFLCLDFSLLLLRINPYNGVESLRHCTSKNCNFRYYNSQINDSGQVKNVKCAQ